MIFTAVILVFGLIICLGYYFNGNSNGSHNSHNYTRIAALEHDEQHKLIITDLKP